MTMRENDTGLSDLAEVLSEKGLDGLCLSGEPG